MQRQTTFRVVALLGSAAIGLSVAAFTIFIYLKWSQATKRDVDPGLRHMLGLTVGLDENYLNLMQELTENEEQFFTAIETFHGISMSKRLFAPTDMYGMNRYRMRPNINAWEVNIWTGVNHHNLLIPATPRIDALLEKCTLRHRVYFETNEFGFKRTEEIYDPDSPVIFFLGDSYTEGLHTEPKDTFVNLVGRRFQENGISVRPMNLGVNGYGVLEHCWMLEHYAPLIEPKVAIVNLFPNDVQREEGAVVSGMGVPEQRYREFFGYLDRIANYCDTSNIQLIVAAIPSSSQISSLRGHTVFQDRIGAWCKTRDLTFIDPLDEFIASENTLYIPWDGHLTVEGHRLYADVACRESQPIVAKVCND